MEFSGFIQRLSGNVLTLYNVNAITDVKSVSAYEEISNGAFQKKEFRWSEDRSRWTDWAILNQDNIKLAQPRSGETTLYFEFKYTKHSANIGVVSKITIIYSNTPSTETESLPIVIPTPGTSQTGPVGSPIINANLLSGQPGSFYLLRSNHQGTQSISTIDGLSQALYNLSSGLQNVTIQAADNEPLSGIGTYSRKDNNTLFFKTLYSPNNTVIITEDVSGQINLDVSTSIDVGALIAWNIAQDTSIIILEDKVDIIDNSIAYISNYDVIQDVSILDNKNGVSQLDVSIVRLDAYDAIQDVSISLSVLGSGDGITVDVDNSINFGGAFANNLWAFSAKGDEFKVESYDVSLIGVAGLAIQGNFGGDPASSIYVQNLNDNRSATFSASVDSHIMALSKTSTYLRSLEFTPTGIIMLNRNGSFKFDTSILEYTNDVSSYFTSLSLINLGYADSIYSSLIYVDGSLAKRDASIISNTAGVAQLDSSIIRLDAYDVIQDASIAIPSVAGTDGQIQFNNLNSLAGDTSLFFEVSTGKLGLGTSNPESLLHTKSSGANILKIESATSSGAIAFFGNDLSTNATAGQLSAFANNNVISVMNFHLDGAADDAGVISFFTKETGQSNQEKMRLTSTGRLGIGTSTPSEILDVSGNITASGSIYTSEVSNPAGILKIQPNANANVDLFGDTDVDDAANGPSFNIHRRAAEGDHSIMFFINDGGESRLISSGIQLFQSGSVMIFKSASDMRLLQNPEGNLDIFRGSLSGDNFEVLQNGYITAAGDDKYISWKIDDSTDKFILDREDSNILGFKVNMPLEVDGSVGIGTSTPTQVLDVSGNLKVNSILYDTSFGPVSEVEGLTWWNPQELALNIATGIGPVLQVGQEIYILIYNNNGETIPNGCVLRPKAATIFQGQIVPTMQKAQADNHANAGGTLMVATMDISDNTIGLATRFGRVRGMNTSGLTPGVTTYLDPDVSGALTNTRPTFPDYAMSMGAALSSDPSDGEFIVSITGAVNDTFDNFHNGTFREPFFLDVSTDGTTVSGYLTPQNGHPFMSMIFSDGFTDLTADPSIDLTVGTETNPQENFVYITKANKILEVSTSDWPVTEEHIKVATISIQDASSVLSVGALKNHNWNDRIQNNINQGHLSHIAEKLRQFEAQWQSGAAGSIFINTTPIPDDVFFSNTSGEVYQIHRQTFPAFDTSTGDNIFVVNHATTPYISITNLNTQIVDALGATLNNSSFSFIIWGVTNSRGEDQLMLNLPTGSYAFNNPTSAVNDSLNFSVYDIPFEFRGTGFLIGRYTFTYKNDDWVLFDSEDLRGKIPNTTAGGGAGGAGVTDFTGLTDTPSAYTGNGLQLIQINSAETALEFTNSPSIALTIQDPSITALNSYDVIQDVSIALNSTLLPIIEMSDVNIIIDSSWNNYFIKLTAATDCSVSFDQTDTGVNLTFTNETANTTFFYSGTGAPVLKSKDSAVTMASQYGMTTCVHDGSSWYLSGNLQ